MTEAATTEIVLSKKDEEKALAMYNFEAGGTHDELDKDSYAIPRIAVLEKMSPQVDADDAEYIEGAKPGVLCNTVFEELYPEGLWVIPVKRRDTFLEWNQRKDGGGFVAEHTLVDGRNILKQCTRNDTNFDITPNGTELHNPLEFYVLYTADKGETWHRAAIAMNRTRRKEGKKWNSRIDSFMRGGQQMSPLAQVYELGTARREGEQVSYLFKVGKGHFLPEFLKDADDVYAQAKLFLDQIDSGAAKVDREAEAAQAGNTADQEVEEF